MTTNKLIFFVIAIIWFISMLLVPSGHAELLDLSKMKCDQANSIKYSTPEPHDGLTIYNPETNTMDIYFNPDFMNNFSINAQKFIFYHECAHANKIDNEQNADKYAFQMLSAQNLMDGKLVQELCSNHIKNGYLARCNNLINLFLKKK
jgi:hypothetical protein